MSLFYQYASLMFDGGGVEQPKAWYHKVSSLLPRRKKDELKDCQRQDGNFLYNSIIYAIHLETSWWFETNVAEYSANRRFLLPQWDKESMSLPLAWKLYWMELKQRLLPPLLKYQVTLLCVTFFQSVLSSIVSKETLLRLNQHPPRRAVAIAERESDRLLMGMEVFVATIWANALFVAANYTVIQIGALYHYYTQRKLATLRGDQFWESESRDVLVNTSWGLFARTARRLFYSAAGAGLASIVWPGWGTLLGIGIGDEWARYCYRSNVQSF